MLTILRHFQYAESSILKSQDSSRNVKIINANVDDDPKIDIDSNLKYIIPPRDVTINTLINYSNEKLYTPVKLDNDEDDNFFQIHNSEMDEYREVDDYNYKQDNYDKYLRGCSEIRHCTKACNKVQKTLCEEFNCKKFKTTFRKMCREKCEKFFSDDDEDGSDSYDSDEYY